jgi:four helix bundle protein
MTGVSTFEELDAWKLASELCDLVYAMTENGRAARDQKFQGQIRDSAASAPRNISEGFGRFNPRENANYVRWAKASLQETRNHLRHGHRQRYFSAEDFEAALTLAKRALGATTRYWQYLDSCEGNVPGQPPAKRPPERPKRSHDRNKEPSDAAEPETRNPNAEPGT